MSRVKTLRQKLHEKFLIIRGKITTQTIQWGVLVGAFLIVTIMFYQILNYPKADIEGFAAMQLIMVSGFSVYPAKLF